MHVIFTACICKYKLTAYLVHVSIDGPFCEVQHPMNFSNQRTVVALVICLAKLRNYCINADNSVVLLSTASEEWQHEMNGAVLPMVATDHSDSKGGMTLCQLLGGWNHFDDVVGICGCYNQQR